MSGALVCCIKNSFGLGLLISYCLSMATYKVQMLEVQTTCLLRALMRYEQGHNDPAINYEALRLTVAKNLAELDRLQN